MGSASKRISMVLRVCAGMKKAWLAVIAGLAVDCDIPGKAGQAHRKGEIRLTIDGVAQDVIKGIFRFQANLPFLRPQNRGNGAGR